MKLAFGIPNLMQVKAITKPWETRVTGAEMVKLARWADQLGYEMICVPEHFIIPREHVELSGAHHVAAHPTMGFFAGATERIKVNSCIALLPLQHPVVTAKNLSTIDWLSGGRAMITFASGWCKGEYDAMGVPFHERGAMADEYIAAIIELWTKESPEFEGKYVNFRDVAFEPKCVQRPHLPVWFGGEAKPVLRRVARHASGWWPAQQPYGRAMPWSRSPIAVTWGPRGSTGVKRRSCAWKLSMPSRSLSPGCALTLRSPPV